VLTRPAEPLTAWTTLRLGGPAATFVETVSRSELYDLVAVADAEARPVLVLGGGSNVVVGDQGFDGTVIRVASSGVQVGAHDATGVEVTVEAGESWEPLVLRAVEQGWIGVETLAGIPGTVGAVPVQNVGAYGQEVSDTISSVHVYDRAERRTRTLPAAECGFGYRTSVFKRTPGRYVVGGVTFRLRRGPLGAPVTYGELASTLGLEVGEAAPAAAVSSAVLALRRAKGMVLDEADHDTWSAGSFFTNPWVPPDMVPAGAPAFAQSDGNVKTGAAWLIERAGFSRGYGNDKVCLSTKHTLALTNRGSASTDDLLVLAREIRDGVHATFGIELHPEPVLVRCTL